MMKLSEILKFPAIENADEFMKEGESNPFYKEAKALMSEYWIRKVSGGKTRYYFINDIELYYYSKEHEDRYVYPHFYTEAGRFRVHFSGVDITFATNWEGKEEEILNTLVRNNPNNGHNPTLDYESNKAFITSGVSYGGLLIREIQEYKEGIEAISPINGPWCVGCELFHMEGNTLELQLDPNTRGDSSITVHERINLKLKEGWGESEQFKNHLKRYSFKK